MGCVSVNPRPVTGEDDWTGLCPAPIDAASVHDWLVRPDCGAVVVFSGTARDHAGDRTEVEALTYEAWESQASERIGAVVTELRRRWPEVGAVAVLHRTGEVPVGSSAVLVGVSAPHRDEAFGAARYGIDAVKAAVPIWKRERHSGGEDWGLEGAEMVDPADVDAARNGAPNGAVPNGAVPGADTPGPGSAEVDTTEGDTARIAS